MTNPIRLPRWSPYVVGAGIGVLSWVTFYFMNKALGTSTSFVGASGALLCTVACEHVEQNAYFAKTLGAKGGGFKPVFDWQMALVFTMALGAFISAWFGRTFKVERVPTLWQSRFGPSVAKRYAAAFVGGVILIFGARMADGCTSGHGISGGLQLAVSSWTFFVAMFATGILTALVLYGRGPKEVTRVQ